MTFEMLLFVMSESLKEAEFFHLINCGASVSLSQSFIKGGGRWEVWGGDYFPNFTNSSEFQIEMINDVIYNMVGPLISYLP